MCNLKKRITTRYEVKINHATYEQPFKVQVDYKRAVTLYLISSRRQLDWSTLDWQCT